ncbi:MAG: benzoate-CoA ligase family protein [Proteobacteria bacterium]|nr:MAG: benzoate-CoA ligase family protein [Pseudomonadota bacterium]
MNAADAVLGRGRERAGDDTVAIIESRRSVTYRQLDSLVNRYGNAMRAAGVRRENRVLFLLDDGADLVAAYLAAIRIGAVAVAFNLRASAADLKHAIEETRAPLLFIEADLLDVYAGIEGGLAHRPVLVCSGDVAPPNVSIDEFAAHRSDRPCAAATSADDMAFWVYSSGTTGAPKAVVHLHHDVLEADRHLVENLGVGPGDRLYCTSKIFFAYALGNILLGGLRAGATLVLQSGWPDAGRVVDIVARHRPDYFFTVPTLYRVLLASGGATRPIFGGVRCCVSAGESLPECVFDAWREATGVPIFEGIGTSETLFLVIANHPCAWRAGRTGRPQRWVEARLVGDEDQVIEEPGAPGSLWIKAGSVADRYWNRQELSRHTFVGDWYATGDMFSFDEDGWWRYHGRRDSMLKVSGQWVSPTEIEECACTSADVSDAAVVGRPNVDGLVRATLFVVPAGAVRGEEAALTERVLAHLRERLAVYKCPRDIRVLDDLPRTASGKVQRYVLREWAGG